MDCINFTWAQQIRVILIVVLVNHVFAVIFMIGRGRMTLVEIISEGKVCLARFRCWGHMVVRTVVGGRVLEWLMCWLMVVLVVLVVVVRW